eukprot:CAMPEP_0180526650 /NCGR_PEP_ID=MMETSP1036_2-20121128/59806_1 /TAXON_ID=632150 /ORGANISM="Azadinium spinosum, Strain 3D9" /LENGTH=33 /DNA_ID= /DNA_START= /DNA_END= /DNA_ORIENTATION=
MFESRPIPAPIWDASAGGVQTPPVWAQRCATTR